MISVLLAIVCGGLVGFTLGLVGGGGSILATPLLLYVVGLSPHVAIGTSALSVSANAFLNLASHARRGNVRWGPAAAFALIGSLTALLGSALGKAFDARHLLFLFALLMACVGVLMLRRKNGSASGNGPIRFRPLRIVFVASGVGLLSGFFGVGGGFLIVPGLLLSTGMPTICAVGSSLLAVGAFGLTTAGSYAASGLVDWTVSAEYVVGGALGGFVGMSAACRVAAHKEVLNRIFAAVILAVSAYMLFRNTLG